jgi:hypothetical protein
MNNELVRMQTEAATVYFESKYLSGGTEKNHFIPCRIAYNLYLPLFIYLTLSDLSLLKILHFFRANTGCCFSLSSFSGPQCAAHSAHCLLCARCLAHFLTLKMEVVHCSETLVSQPAQHSIPEDSTVEPHYNGQLKKIVII